MLDIKYYKDYRHNYLIIKDNGSLSENVYQRKMVTENRIKGLLVSQERNINGEILLYYEITSKQSLFSIYENKSINMEQLGKFFVQLKVVNDMLQKYLLDGSCLILLPEYIFQNIETGEYFFLYYPDSNEGNFSQLIDFFISRIDNEDMEVVEIIYKIADLVNREQFVLDEVLKWFQDDIEEREKKNNMEVQYQEAEYDNRLLYDNESGNAQEDLQVYSSSKSLFEKKDGDENKRSLIKIIPIWVISVLAVGVLIYIGYFYQLSYQEEIYLIIAWILVAVTILGTIIWYFYPQLKKKKNVQEQENTQKEQRFIPTYEKDMTASAADMGNTVFIPWTENCENKLYSMDKKIKSHIDLGSLPLTVGKLAGAVDMVIDEKSISRMHAKFFRNGNKVYVADLNSTNGTFRNGMRLTPNASEIIEPGDEIRLGKLKFIYR